MTSYPPDNRQIKPTNRLHTVLPFNINHIALQQLLLSAHRFAVRKIKIHRTAGREGAER